MTYDDRFFAENLEPSARSAAVVMPTVIEWVRPRTVVDVGCASGQWGAAAYELGCEVKGVDGHVPEERVLLRKFERVDLRDGYDCSGFDLAICLEVGEHLPESSAEALVAGLCKARWVLFSAAIPGQRGVDHVNEQWGTWWANLFAAWAYIGSCDLRWRFWADRRIQDFYRQNMILFAAGKDLVHKDLRPGVIDVIHPERLGVWP